jgi:hypothetical protein
MPAMSRSVSFARRNGLPASPVLSAAAAACLALATSASTPARAADGDVFRVDAATTSGPQQSASASGSNLIALAESALDRENQFQSLVGQPFTAALAYGGVGNAIVFESNGPGTSVTLRIPSTGFERTFTGGSQEDVEQRIEDFLREDGAGEYAAFLRAMNEQSLVAGVDGNPQAATAFVARHAYKQFAYNPTLSLGPSSSDDNGNTRLDVSGGTIEADATFTNLGSSFSAQIDGWFLAGEIGSAWKFGDHFGLSLSAAFQWRQTDEADSYTAGSVLGLPITIINTEEDGTGFGWRVTPFGLGAVNGSEDLASGGLLLGGGLANVFHLGIGALMFNFGSQLAYFDGTDVGWGDYEFQTDVDQPVLTNGIRVAFMPDILFVDAGVSYTSFLDDAAVEDFVTPTVGIGARWSQYSGIRIGYTGDFGDDYTTHGGNVLLYFSY